jgi:hypothetical protein
VADVLGNRIFGKSRYFLLVAVKAISPLKIRTTGVTGASRESSKILEHRIKVNRMNSTTILPQ